MEAAYIPIAIFTAGVASHLFYFRRNEHHTYSVRYFQLLVLAFAIAPLHVSWKSDGGVGVQYMYSGARWQAILVFLAGINTSLLTYRLLFHPLNKFPGPLGARLSDLWYSYKCSDAHGNLKLVELHQRYGDFVRIGSSSLSVTHPEAVQAIYGLGSKCGKGYWYDNDAPYFSMHTTRPRPVHDARRRVWSPAFSDKALRGYEERMRPYVDRLIAQLHAFDGRPVNASEWFNFLTYDVLGDLAFNKSFNMLERGEQHWAIKLLNGGMDPLHWNFPEWLFAIIKAIPGASGDFWKFIEYCVQAVEQRMRENPHVPDIMTSLLAPYQKSGPPTDRAERALIHADSRLIIVAGSDTTAATLTHLFCRLCQNPQYIQRLRDELTPHVNEDGDSKNSDILNCELLNGCINEALRLNPPVPSMLQRLTPPEGITIGSEHIAGICKVWSPQYVVSRNENVYRDAEAFVPERWFSKPEMILDGGKSFAPFGGGVWSCIGKPLALMEVRKVVAKVLTNFDVDFALGEDGQKLLYETRDHFTLGMAPLKLVFTDGRKA